MGQQKLFSLTPEQRTEKFGQLLEALNRKDILTSEKKSFNDEINDQIKTTDKEIATLREELGEPESALGPQMRAARDEERARQ